MKRMHDWESKTRELQERIGYSFHRPNLLMEALTHSSFANEWKAERLRDNERLEFLGDSVLSLIVSQYVFEKYRHLPEGELTKVRANVVCEPSLAMKARRIEIGRFLLLGKGEDTSGGRNRESILADALESLIAAIYLDGGFNKAQAFVIGYFKDLIDLAAEGQLMSDYKTKLQEIWQKEHLTPLEYHVVNESGPDHHKTFFVEVKTETQVLGSGKGKNKKEAEQKAARSAIQRMTEELSDGNKVSIE